MRNKILYFIFCLLMALSGCDKTPHETEGLPVDASGILVELNTNDVADKPLRNVHLYFFDATNKLIRQEYYGQMENLALERLLLDEGYYTIFAVLNTLPELTLPSKTPGTEEIPDITLAEFKAWVHTLPEHYPDLLTGMVCREITKGVELVTIDIKAGAKAMGLTKLTLRLTFPSPLLPDFVMRKSRAAGTDVRLRIVLETYLKGTEKRVVYRKTFVTPTADEGVYTTDLLILPGEYDLCIWGDYTSDEQSDLHYLTADMKMIRILPKEQYTANTDTRDGFAQTVTLIVPDEDKTEAVTMHRPLAKYRIVADDVQSYEELRRLRGLPPLEELNIAVVYESFLPCAYNIAEGKPNDSQQGYHYASDFSDKKDSEVTVCKDFILVNGNQSAVTMGLRLTDKNGKLISGLSGIRVDYRAGYLTTVRGNFLTAGMSGGVYISTEWDGTYEVEF